MSGGGIMMNRIVHLLVVVLFGLGASGCDYFTSPSEEECVKLVDHISEARMKEQFGDNPLSQAGAKFVQALSKDTDEYKNLISECQSEANMAYYKCAMKATDMSQIKACGD